MKYLKFWFPVILYSAIIFGVSSIPDLKTPLAHWQLDKGFHVLEYLCFGGLVARAICAGQRKPLNPYILFGIILISLAYGLSDEVHQTFVGGRHFEAWDIVADVIGGLLGALVYWAYHAATEKTTN